MMIRKSAVNLGRGAAIAVLLLAAQPASADVVGSRHDLTVGGSAFTDQAVTDRVCVFCHTPHAASAVGRPLWNRALGVGPYTMYDNAFSSTIDMAVAGAPVGVSAACLSCHDGTVAFDALINGPTLASGAWDYDASATSRGWGFSSGNNMSGQGVTLLGTDLTNDHPISVTYDNVADPQFNAAVAGSVGALPLYGGNVECGTCHNPHQTAIAPFLRISNAASALCTTCHIK